MRELIERYKYAILSVTGIVIFLYLSFLALRGLNPIVTAIAGLLFYVPIRFFWQSFNSPVLKINKSPEVVLYLFDKKKEERMTFEKWEYLVNRIIIENFGRSAAENCKGYIVLGNNKERLCWTVPKERPNATINAKDSERLDFCAFYMKGPHAPKVIAPTEEGWPEDPSKCRDLTEIKDCEVLVTASNTKPIKARIKIDKENNRIIIM